MNPILLIDIDGLRPDVLQRALRAGNVPNLARLFRGSELPRGLWVEAVSSAPSITFCAQASLFTGKHPAEHGIPGNQFFDRFGTNNNGVPQFFAFDVGDTLEVDDAVQVFTNGLASERLQTPTIYERLAVQSLDSVVAGNMYAEGANTWLKPSLLNLARFTRGGSLFGMTSAHYDGQILSQAVEYLAKNGMPDVFTMYFLGIDHESHKHGPTQGQMPYLVNHIDPMVGQLWDAVLAAIPDSARRNLIVVVVSDHGQIDVIRDDQHSLRIGFPFDREMGDLFTSLGLDVHDYPGEVPNCDAVMALNGGLAFVYLHNQAGHWGDPPHFQRDVLPVARAFWDAHQTGVHASDLHGALAGVLVRNVDDDGWMAPYYAFTPEGNLVSLEDWFATQPDDQYLDPVHRIRNFTGLYSGDMILISNYAEGYYFGGENSGVHGGLHPEDSRAVLSLGMPYAPEPYWVRVKAAMAAAVRDRCAAEGGRMACLTDLRTALNAAISVV